MKIKHWVYIFVSLLLVIFLFLIYVYVDFRSQVLKGDSVSENQCRRVGCSGHLCEDENERGLMTTTCEWRPSYGCLKKYSVCKKQKDGECGWTETVALKLCLKSVGWLN